VEGGLSVVAVVSDVSGVADVMEVFVTNVSDVSGVAVVMEGFVTNVSDVAMCQR
jgi:hypothetical protein